ncbi:hypothetical protein J132_08680 [Termitomyces sp. J132]|nr:hypothetical protein J132_08680 [Termitomyces sp. J132]
MEPAHKFLGVVLDQELRFKEHVAYAQGKGAAVAAQTQRLAKVNGGIHGTMVQRVYKAVVAPNMLYTVDIWCRLDVEVEGMTVWGVHPKDMETIEVMRLPPDWKCPIKVIHGEMEEEVVKREGNNKADIRIYTDRSGYKGNVGVAVVLYRGREKAKVMRKFLGSEEKHMVFEGECVKQVLGFELLRGKMRG